VEFDAEDIRMGFIGGIPNLWWLFPPCFDIDIIGQGEKLQLK